MGLRGEWFRDQVGFRYGNNATGYYSITLGLNWKPSSWLAIRPELRHAWADSPVKAYANGAEHHQWLLGTDLVAMF